MRHSFLVLSSCMFGLQGTEPAGLAKEAVLSWLAAAAGTATVRTSGGETKGALDKQSVRQGSSDGFMLGLLGMCLLFCKPFLGGEQKHLDRLSVSYYSDHAYRCDLLPYLLSLSVSWPRDHAYRLSLLPIFLSFEIHLLAQACWQGRCTACFASLAVQTGLWLPLNLLQQCMLHDPQ